MKLKIYKEDNRYILERVNQFNHATKRYLDSKEALIETLETYPNLHEYEVEADHELWAVLINALQK